jgi:hypothetical protein
MSTVPTIDAKIDGAIYIWNSVVLKDGLPEFTRDVGSRTVEIAWGNAFNLTASPYYCGDTYPSLTYIVIHRSGAKQVCGLTSTGGGVRFTNAVPLSGLSALIAHELSHAIGFKHLSQSGPQFNSAADHCVASLPASGGANGSLCQAEIELLRYNFGLRRTAEPDPTKHFATGFEVATSGLPSPITVGQSGTLTVSVVQFGRGAPPSSFTPPAANTLSYRWKSDNLAVATVGTSTGSSNPLNAEGDAHISLVLDPLRRERHNWSLDGAGGQCPRRQHVPADVT